VTTSRAIEIVGGVVRRPAAEWTPTVHSLLRHLVDAGVPVPEPLEIVDGVETVHLLPGHAGEDAWPQCTSLAGVRSAGGLLRAVHDATATWSPPHDAVWAVPAEKGSAGVLCHGDPKPPNMTWDHHRATGLFDWDAARPAPRLSDVAYALLWIAPFFEEDSELRRRGLPTDVDVMTRAESFLEGYGWSDPIDLVTVVTARRRQAIAEVTQLGRRGIEPHATWVARGWPERWLGAMAAHRHFEGTS
jgi:Ser/Thr protein kinase RdoA (MazF antagonist)